jgi:CRISPR-associated protein Cas4
MMEGYILISYLNDFIFCPISIYYHQLYGGLSTRIYQDLPQIEGKFAHEAIDEKKYSSKKNTFQGMEIFSQKYNLCGKIDIFDADIGLLTERKKHISKIYDGYIFQLYAQYFCLTEMGYVVKNMRFYSKDDNRIFPVELPEENKVMYDKFTKIIEDINSFNISSYSPSNNRKCQRCIYESLCDRSLI